MPGLDDILRRLLRMEGAVCAGIVERDSARLLAAAGNGSLPGLSARAVAVAARAAAELDGAAGEAAEDVEDLLVTSAAHFHVLRRVDVPGGETVIVYVRLQRGHGNPAACRRELGSAELRESVVRACGGEPAPRPAALPAAGPPPPLRPAAAPVNPAPVASARVNPPPRSAPVNPAPSRTAVPLNPRPESPTRSAPVNPAPPTRLRDAAEPERETRREPQRETRRDEPEAPPPPTPIRAGAPAMPPVPAPRRPLNPPTPLRTAMTPLNPSSERTGSSPGHGGAEPRSSTPSTSLGTRAGPADEPARPVLGTLAVAPRPVEPPLPRVSSAGRTGLAPSPLRGPTAPEPAAPAPAPGAADAPRRAGPSAAAAPGTAPAAAPGTAPGAVPGDVSEEPRAAVPEPDTAPPAPDAPVSLPRRVRGAHLVGPPVSADSADDADPDTERAPSLLRQGWMHDASTLRRLLNGLRRLG